MWLRGHQQAAIRRAYQPTPELSTWQRNRRVLTRMCEFLDIRPDEQYAKSTPYMQLATAVTHWAGPTFAITLATSSFPKTPDIEAVRRQRVERLELGHRFADHWRSTGFDPFVLTYPDFNGGARGYEAIEADTTDIREHEAAGLPRDRIYWSFILAPGSAHAAREMMLAGVPEEYIRAAVGSHDA